MIYSSPSVYAVAICAVEVKHDVTPIMVQVHCTCWPWGFEDELPDRLADWLSCSTENNRCPAARCYKGGASFEECAQYCNEKGLFTFLFWFRLDEQVDIFSVLVLTMFNIFCILTQRSTHLDGSEDPRSEKPFVRVSSSGQGLLGVNSTSSDSP